MATERTRLAGAGHGGGKMADGLFRVVTMAAALLILAIVVGLAVDPTWGIASAARAIRPELRRDANLGPSPSTVRCLTLYLRHRGDFTYSHSAGSFVGVGAALFLVELAPRRLYTPLSALVELLAAIPSVVYGLWGIFVLAPLLRTVIEPPACQHARLYSVVFRGRKSASGCSPVALSLAIMILPTVTAISRDVIRTVPQAQREGAAALGATRWEIIWTIILPYARSGILGAVILGLGRALGETIAVTMVVGARPQITHSLFSLGYTIAAVIANEFTEATYQLYLSALFELGLILLAITMVLNILARLLVWRITRGAAAGVVAQ